MIRNYIVHCKRGRLAVSVPQSVIDLRGERYAIAQLAWHKLLGLDPLGEKEKGKAPPTRDILMDEIYSRPKYARGDVFWIFHDTIKFTLVSLGGR